MYNIAHHYGNVYQYLKTIVTDPRVLYLHPFGSTQPENIEIIRDDRDPPRRRGPLFIFYDQEPIHSTYNQKLFSYIKHNTAGPHVLITTERDSTERDIFCQRFSWPEVNYFFHLFAAHDWYRGHEFDSSIIQPQDRKIEKTYITFNRLTSNERVYRSLFINSLFQHGLLDRGYVSFSHDCPDGGPFDENLRQAITNQQLDTVLVEQAIANINTLPELRIDFTGEDIPNQSMLLTPMPELMSSFVFVVTETCFWQAKTHLTEKIFKPIVLKMPFILLGCAHNLAYLRSYGFKTFGDYWDESYDTIEDPIQRIEAVSQVLKGLEGQDLKALLLDMQPILEHNYALFNSPNLLRNEWNHLTSSLKSVALQFPT